MRISQAYFFLLLYFSMGFCFIFSLSEDFQIMRHLALSLKVSFERAAQLENYQMGGFLLGCLLAPLSLNRFSTRLLIWGYSVVLLLDSFLILFFKNFFFVEFFYAWVGLGFGLIRILAYNKASDIYPNLLQLAGFLCKLEGAYALGLLLNFSLINYFSSFDTPDITMVYWIVIFLFGIIIFSINSISDIEKETVKPLDKIKQVWELLSYNLVGLFVACLFIFSTVEYHFVAWLGKSTVDFFPTKSLRFEIGLLTIFASAIFPFLISTLVKHIRIIQLINLLLFGFIILSISIVENFKHIRLSNNYETIWDIPAFFSIFYIQIGFWSPILPLLFSLAIKETPKMLRASLLSLAFGLSAIFSIFGKYLSSYLYLTFSPLISYLFISIAISALIVLIMLFTSDLSHENS